MKHVAWKLGAWLVALTATGAAVEFALRRADWSYRAGAYRDVRMSVEEDRRMSRGESMYEFHPHQLWAPRPGALIPWTTGERINPDGYRGPQIEVERQPKTLRIAVLGGAAALGKGVRYEDTFTALVGRYVAEQAMPTEVMNLGVEGFSARQCLERYRDLARPYRPHVVILSLRLEPSYREAPGALTDDQKIRLARADAEAGLSPDAARSRSWRVGEGLAWVRDALSGSYWEERDFQFQLQRLSGGSGSLDWPGVRRVPIDDFYYSILHLYQETRQDGAHLILLVIPTAPGVDVPPVRDVYLQSLVEFAQRQKILFLDARTTFVDSLREDIVKEDLFQADHYPSECGHAQLAEALSGVIVRGIREKSAGAPREQNGAGEPRREGANQPK